MGPFLVGHVRSEYNRHYLPYKEVNASSVAKIQLAPVVLVGATCGCFIEGQAGNSALRQPGGGGCGGMIRRSGF